MRWWQTTNPILSFLLIAVGYIVALRKKPEQVGAGDEAGLRPEEECGGGRDLVGGADPAGSGVNRPETVGDPDPARHSDTSPPRIDG